MAGGREPAAPARGLEMLRWLALLSLLPVLNARAQTPPPAAAWTLTTLRSGLCIAFLADPARVASDFHATRFRVAGEVDSLQPALARVLASSPEYRTWIPASVCLYQFASVDAGRQHFEDRKHGRPQGIVMWSMPAVGSAGWGTLLVTNSHLASTVRRLGVDVNTFRSESGRAPGQTEDRYAMKFAGTIIVWGGHPTGDSLPGPPIDVRWAAPRRNGTTSLVRARIEAAGARILVGALRVEGKGILAELLRRSPIRYVGPLVWGGAGEVTFGS